VARTANFEISKLMSSKLISECPHALQPKGLATSPPPECIYLQPDVPSTDLETYNFCDWRSTMMIKALLVISTAAIRVGQGQSTTGIVPPLPSCAASCVVSVCNASLATDFNCFCDVDYGLSIEGCWSESCSPNDIGSAYVALNSVCCTFPLPLHVKCE